MNMAKLLDCKYEPAEWQVMEVEIGITPDMLKWFKPGDVLKAKQIRGDTEWYWEIWRDGKIVMVEV